MPPTVAATAASRERGGQRAGPTRRGPFNENGAETDRSGGGSSVGRAPDDGAQPRRVLENPRLGRSSKRQKMTNESGSSDDDDDNRNHNNNHDDDDQAIAAQYQVGVSSKNGTLIAAKARPRPTLTAAQLTTGLDRVLVRVTTDLGSSGFPRLTVKPAQVLPPPNPSTSSSSSTVPAPAAPVSLAAAAAYSRALMHAYTEALCDDLGGATSGSDGNGGAGANTSQLHLQDVLHKIERLGGTAPVRQWLREQRNACRDRHVRAVLGPEAAHALLLQLDDYRDDHRVGYTSAVPPQPHNNTSNHTPEAARGVATATATAAANLQPPREEEEEEQEATFQDEPLAAAEAATVDATSNNDATRDEDDDEYDAFTKEMERHVAAEVAMKRQNRRRFVVQDSDDDGDGEAEFVDECAASASIADAGTAASSVGRGKERHIAKTSDEENEEENSRGTFSAAPDPRELQTTTTVRAITTTSGHPAHDDDHKDTAGSAATATALPSRLPELPPPPTTTPATTTVNATASGSSQSADTGDVTAATRANTAAVMPPQALAAAVMDSGDDNNDDSPMSYSKTRNKID